MCPKQGVPSTHAKADCSAVRYTPRSLQSIPDEASSRKSPSGIVRAVLRGMMFAIDLAVLVAMLMLVGDAPQR